MSNYTKGKWEIKKIGYPEDAEYWITNNQNVLARIPNVIDEAEAEANARLIAAAPELLEACKKTAGNIARWPNVAPPDKVWKQKFIEVLLPQLQAAIEAAEKE